MAPLWLIRSSARVFSWLRRGAVRVRAWLFARPRLGRWFFVELGASTEAGYRAFNERYFASFHQQERMLADGPRMRFYQAAISRHVQPGARVIDLGTGTGILAAMAARRGASQVYAIDHSDILKHARSLAVANRVQNVKFIGKHSTAFSLDERVDVILHEQMGDCLFDESMVANVTDLRDRLLKPGGLILPSCFDFYCEPVKLRDYRHVPFIWELNVCGYDYSSLERNRPQEPGYYHLVSSDLNLVEHFIGEPEPVLSIDLHTVIESAMPRDITFTRTVLRAGRMDGYAIYFRARVDNDLYVGSSPLDAGRAPHWGFRILRCDRADFNVGDVLEINLSVASWPELDSWRWRLVKRTRAERETTAGMVAR